MLYSMGMSLVYFGLAPFEALSLHSGTEMLVELQNMERFKRAEELASFIGLTPSEFSTGQYVRQGRITRSGNKRVRTCLVESSWILIQKDPVLRSKYNRLKSKKGAKRAIILLPSPEIF